jgi:hypothetical protein
MQTMTRYEIESRVVPFGNGTIRINNHKPILSPKERERRKKEIERQLYAVLIKYTDKK